MLTDGAGPAPQLWFGVLGPLTVRRAGRPIALGAPKQQQVLAMLLCRANAVTSVDLLLDAVWGATPPRTARKNLQVYIVGLRKLLGSPQRISHCADGYLLRADPAELDLLRFEELLRHAQATGDSTERLANLTAALRLWRGSALDGLTGSTALAAEADRLSLRQLAAFEDWAEAELAAGDPGAVLEPASELAARHPFRERLCQLQMTALHRTGRRAEALGVYQELRQALARELGLPPSRATERLYRGMLGDPAGPAARRPLVLLPPELADFTGRAEPLREIGLELTRARIALITGPVGVGKTTLAVQAAHQADRAFPDGRIFLGMRGEHGASRSARSVLAQLLLWAGQAGLDGCELEELAGRWQAWLMRRRLLLVLDDAWDSTALRAVLPLSGGSAVLATSRRLLVGLDHGARIELPPLPVTEAVVLLGRIIGMSRVAAERGAAERVVQAVGCLPLAVRSVGNKLHALPHLSLADFAARLSRPDELLAELGTAEEMLRGRLAAGLTDLAEGERWALRRLGALEHGRFTVEQAATALAEVPHRARRLVESLVETHVVTAPAVSATADAAVYELPCLLRCYLRELAVAEGDALAG